MPILQLISVIMNQILAFIILKVIDAYNYIAKKKYKEFNGFGLHIYTGLFGSGKTSSMVRDAYVIAKKYPQVTILSNMELKNFPKHTKVEPLVKFDQIIKAPANTLI